MTTEEIKQKGIKYACEYPSSQDLGYKRLGYKRVDLRKAYITGATETTKELQEENRQLKNIKDVADLLRLNNDTVITMCQLNNQLVSANQKIAELKKQIEKMKCCSNCKHYSTSFLPYFCTKNNTAPHCTSKCDKWELAE